MQSLILIFLTGGFLALACLLGRVALIRLGLADSGFVSSAAYSTALGLGLLGLGVFGLQLAGLFDGWALLILLLWVCFVVMNGLRASRGRILAGKGAASGLRTLAPVEKVFLALAFGLLGLALLQSLTPPWDYDGLMYHLQGPRLFLQKGRLLPIPENWLTFYPFLVEMIFSVGLAWGSDIFARLIHLAYAVLLASAVFAAAERFIGRQYAWLATAILIGIPIFPIWASLAYGDMAWALYEFLALGAVLVWVEGGQGGESAPDLRPLALAGVLTGFALGTKYMALGGAGALGLVVLWHSRRSGWRKAFANIAAFGLPALLVGSPWYLKNWLWTGNPVYPFWISPGGETGERVSLWLEYMNGFGAPRTLIGYLSLPIRIYTEHARFGTFLGSIEIPSILFPLALLVPLTRRSPALNALAGWTLIRFIVWAAGAQQTRFLLPLFPALSLLSAYVLGELSSRLKGPAGRALPRGLGIGMLAIALVYSGLFFVSVKPLGVLFGSESRSDFLRRQLPVYAMHEFIQESLPEQARVWMLWDGRGYTCDERCVADIDQSRWTQLVMHSWDVQQAARDLREGGATHLLVSKQDAVFIARFDRSGLQARAYDFLRQEFMPACTRRIAGNAQYDLVLLNCR